MSNTELTAFCERHGIDANKVWSLFCGDGAWPANWNPACDYLHEFKLSVDEIIEANTILYAAWDAREADPIEVAEPDAPESASATSLVSIEVQPAQAAQTMLTVQEAAELVRVATAAVQDSRSEAVAGNQGRADTTEPGTADDWFERGMARAQAAYEAQAKARLDAILNGTFDGSGRAKDSPGLVAMDPTDATRSQSDKPDGAAAWSNVIDRMRGNGR